MICIFFIHFFLLLVWFPFAKFYAVGFSIGRPPSFLIIGGTGKIGSSVASHLLYKQPNATVILAGRNAEKSHKVVDELMLRYPDADVQYQYGDFDQKIQSTVSASVRNDWRDIFSRVDCVIHTAGPYIDCRPIILETAISAKVPVYVDVGDPLTYLTQCKLLSSAAATMNTTALLAAGAFPGLSNVLAMEAANAVMKASDNLGVRDVKFNYFTAGLGGSGTINLYITNVGFGEPLGLYHQGRLQFFTELSGKLLGKVDFFLKNATSGFGNEMAKDRVGTKQVFAWPFPEGATVPELLRACGSSSVAMGTAPDIWNNILGILVSVVPRQWWRNYQFSQFMADFSQPLVLLTDWWMKWIDPNTVGETHAMRIDVDSVDGRIKMTTIQAHESFRQCVGQSCAEFALDCLEYPTPGVFYPEERYNDEQPRQRIIGKLTSTPGTFCYTGPVQTDHIHTHSSK